MLYLKTSAKNGIISLYPLNPDEMYYKCEECGNFYGIDNLSDCSFDGDVFLKGKEGSSCNQGCWTGNVKKTNRWDATIPTDADKPSYRVWWADGQKAYWEDYGLWWQAYLSIQIRHDTWTKEIIEHGIRYGHLAAMQGVFSFIENLQNEILLGLKLSTKWFIIYYVKVRFVDGGK